MYVTDYVEGVSFKDLYIGVYANGTLIWTADAAGLEEGDVTFDVPYEGLYTGKAKITIAICRPNALGQWQDAYNSCYVCDLDFGGGSEMHFSFENVAAETQEGNTILLNGLCVQDAYASDGYRFKVYV